MRPVYAILFCSACWAEREFCLAPDAAQGDSQPPIECWHCGFRYEPKLVTHLPNGEKLSEPYMSYPISSFTIEKGRERIKQRVVNAVYGSGYDMTYFIERSNNGGV